ncbi:AraC family transcriptional regulator [Maridesulfovibrio salexigens]|uniref:Transcriptional regulator, AraC family n=1 Tax=Maridesulfovibrio salexigens (strain ATCC 14822 / DSM 2638 / NCIMB 8403 / VKM B-1763) TaxID=526222 RepID=C6BUD1_MARSD|nr:AraC family transcriptional regulator [Maridesulfovibrio salexigens]ACS79940.1 transcriptional regulator, AraC family [Maridesulfovibrio salexigens DSM 2638]
MKSTPPPLAPSREYKSLEFSAQNGILGSRCFQNILLRPGLTLTIAKTTPRRNLIASFDRDEAPIQFGFTYSGKNRCSFSNGTLRNQVDEMQSGSNGIFYLPKMCGIIERPKDQTSCVLGIIVSQQFLREYFVDNMSELPRDFQKTLDNSNANPIHWFGPRNPAKQHLLTQIIQCQYEGGLRKLFLESRVMDLLSMQLHDYFKSETPTRSASQPLRPDDVERIREASKFLICDLENPPSLRELAIHVGINERKLKNGFRQVFDTSVFGYFREFRMQKAYDLLQRGDQNVTEVAFSIGYQNLSHFSSAFKKRFGLLPKHFQTNQRLLTTPLNK